MKGREIFWRRERKERRESKYERWIEKRVIERDKREKDVEREREGKEGEGVETHFCCKSNSTDSPFTSLVTSKISPSAIHVKYLFVQFLSYKL